MDDESATDKPLTAAEWDALPPVLTAEQVARVVGVKPAQVLRWANAGTMPGYRIGRQWRFAKDFLTTPGPSGSSGSSGEHRQSPARPADGAGGR